MYNKLFTKILDSTIWLESDATRLVWITFLAVMDEDGFVALSSAGNVAARARVPLEAVDGALKALESPDKSDPSQEHEGRRIERVPYGWMVLNAGKYRDIVQRAESMRKNRERVAKHRAGNGGVTVRNVSVMQSEAVSEAVSETKAGKSKTKVAAVPLPDWLDSKTWTEWLKVRKAKSNTPGSLQAALKKLEGFRAAGFDPNEIVANSLANGWQGLFPPAKARANGTPDYSGVIANLRD
jgi:hypothetical protein